MKNHITTQTLVDRIHGGLAGAVIGDALGAITETLSIRQIRDLYGWIDDFTPLRHKPYDQERVVGAWTDDGSLVVAMTRAAIEGPGVKLDSVIRHLMQWASDPALAKFSGPSTKLAVSRIAGGEDPRVVGMGTVQSFTGASNGGAMKAAPAGWANPGDVAGAAEAAAVICTPTHNTQIAIAGAAAIASACAVACVDGSSVDDVVAASLEGAALGERAGLRDGREVAGPSVEQRIAWAVDIARSASDLPTATESIANRIGAGLNTYESVPAAIGLFVAAAGDVNQTAIAAANIGDDTDTVGCMAAAISGTYSGIESVNRDWYSLVTSVSNIDLAQLAVSLAQVATTTTKR